MPCQISILSLKPPQLQGHNRTQKSWIHHFKKCCQTLSVIDFFSTATRDGTSPTIFRGELVVGVLVDVVPPDGDIDAVGERPVPLHVPFVSID